MHEILLSGWGCPIGELFDLEKLAEHCEKENRYSFFVTSKVNNVPGGVARYSNSISPSFHDSKSLIFAVRRTSLQYSESHRNF
jgi:hypothetical protein